MIGNYLNQTVTRQAKTGMDKYGKPTTGASASVTCRIQNKTKRLKNPTTGVEYTVDAEMWVAASQTLEIDDVVTFEGANYKVTVVEVKKGLAGNTNHKKAYLIRTKE